MPPAPQIAWDSNRASPAEIAETLAAVDETVGLQEVRIAVFVPELFASVSEIDSQQLAAVD